MPFHLLINDLESIIKLQQTVATSTLSHTELMNLICNQAMELTRADGAVVELVEDEEMVYKACAGSLKDSIGLRLNRHTSLSGLCVELNEVLYCEDSETDQRVNREACRKVGARSMICVPLIFNQLPVGVLKVVSIIENKFSEVETKCLRIIAGLISATIAKNAIRNQKDLAYQSLRESENKFRILTESAHDGVLLSKNGIALEANPAFCKLFGYTQENIVGVNNLDLIAPSDRDLVADVLKNKIEKTYKLLAQRKDGTFFHCEGAGKQITINGEEIRMTTLRDISDSIRMEQVLKDAAEKSMQISRAKSEFLANMSHEVRTPLNGILGMVQLLGETDLSKEQQKYVGILKSSADNLLSLVNDILDFSKIEAQKLTLEEIPFDLKMMIEEVYQLLQPSAQAKKLKFSYSIDKNICREYIGDSLRVKQVILNLANNAMKFTPAGEVKIEVTLDDDRLKFCVRDTGIGISDSMRSEMFDPFVQADSSTTRKFGGSGLGLSITKHLVTMMNGSIAVESSLGNGSVFTVKLPLKKVDTEANCCQEIALLETINLEKFPLKLLLVDDNEDNRFIIQTYLKKLPIDITVAENGEIALQKLKEAKFDVALMDIQMPVMDGLQATKLWRLEENQKKLPRTFIAALSAHAFEEERKKSLDAGCDIHLAKPISKKALTEAISNFVQNQRIKESAS